VDESCGAQRPTSHARDCARVQDPSDGAACDCGYEIKRALGQMDDLFRAWSEFRNRLTALVWYLQALNGTATDNWGRDECSSCNRPGMTLLRASRSLAQVEAER